MKTKSILVRCMAPGCKTSVRVVPSSPAAPMLSALEKLSPKGWGYQIGFFAMLTGNHEQRCPQHARRPFPRDPESEAS